jgi:heme A synthase
MSEPLRGTLLSFLVGYAMLWLGWACCRRPWTRQRVARGFLGLGAAVMIMLLVTEATGAYFQPLECGSPCFGGCRWPHTSPAPRSVCSPDTLAVYHAA